MYSSVYISIPISQFILPPPLVTIGLFSTTMTQSAFVKLLQVNRNDIFGEKKALFQDKQGNISENVFFIWAFLNILGKTEFVCL